ncbi:MAG: hypothetical protein ACPHK8_06880 [Thermoplasmatota archaeon]
MNRVAALAPLLICLAFAGCISDDPLAPTGPGTPTDDGKLELTFRPPVDLGSSARIGAFGTNCQDSLVDGDCGLGEPSIEVDGAGAIYVSGVCCLTNPPPVYVSRDGGETFTDLATDTGVRELFGIEGDFAVDAVGRIYFADIEFAGTFQMTVWDKDGNYERHTKWPAPPLVDRDWVRAEGDGHVYYVYNTGTATKVYKSTDAGATFTPVSIYDASYGLGNVAIMPHEELCLFGGSLGGNRSLDCSLDGGESWVTYAAEFPVGDDSYPVGAFDEVGNLFLAEARGGQIVVNMRQAADSYYAPSTQAPAGRWTGLQAITENGTHRMPWIAAGSEGAAAIAWYGTPDDDVTSASEWFLHVASNPRMDFLGEWTIHLADPEPVFVGNLQRELLDFLQVDIGPDGGVHVAYSKLPNDGSTEEQLTYVRSEPSALAMEEYWLGP